MRPELSRLSRAHRRERAGGGVILYQIYPRGRSRATELHGMGGSPPHQQGSLVCTDMIQDMNAE